MRELGLSWLSSRYSHSCSDRDAKQRWATKAAMSGWDMGLGGFGGQLVSGAIKSGLGRVMR